MPDPNHMAIEHYIRYYIKQILLTYLTLLKTIFTKNIEKVKLKEVIPSDMRGKIKLLI